MCYEGLAAFKEDRLVGYLDAIEARAYNMIINDFTTDVITIPTGNDNTVAVIKKTKSVVTTGVNGENVGIELKVKTTLSIVQSSSNTDVSDSQVIKMLEEGFNSQIKKELTEAIKKAQTEFKSDIFGFGCYVHIQHPQEWKRIKDNWDDYFSEAKVTVTVNSSIVMEGETQKNIYLQEQLNES